MGIFSNVAWFVNSLFAKSFGIQRPFQFLGQHHLRWPVVPHDEQLALQESPHWFLVAVNAVDADFVEAVNELASHALDCF